MPCEQVGPVLPFTGFKYIGKGFYCWAAEINGSVCGSS